MPVRPLRPGERYDESLFEVIADVPVRAVITAPHDGFAAPAGAPLAVRGHAWSGHTPLAEVELSIDGGRSWQAAQLGPLPDTFAWRRFVATLAPPPIRADRDHRARERRRRDERSRSSPCRGIRKAIATTRCTG